MSNMNPRGLSPHRAAAARWALIMVCGPGTSAAEWLYSPFPDAEISAGLRAGTAAVTMLGTNLGAGRISRETGLSEGDTTWSEVQFTPWVRTTAARWYGEVSAVGASTFGDGDPAGFTTGGDGDLDVETAVIGWRSGDPADDAEAPVFDLSLGRQALNIGDGFLIDDGNLDSGDDGGVWLVPRQAFQRTLLARVDYRAAHVDLFFLEADPDNDEPAFAGTNLEYRFATQGHLGLLYFHILDADRPTFFAARQGMDVVSARVNDLRLPWWPALALWGEATRQRGEGRNAEFEASAWYAEAIHHFDTLPWSPRLSYRYAYFSGDANPADRRRRDFDPLFYGFDQRGYGTWFQGEVIGGWLLFNSNQRNHLVHLATFPRETLTIGLIGGTFALVESNYLGRPVSDRHFGDELNLYADWTMNARVFVTAAYAVMFPGDGAIEAFRDDENFHIFEVGVNFTF